MQVAGGAVVLLAVGVLARAGARGRAGAGVNGAGVTRRAPADGPRPGAPAQPHLPRATRPGATTTSARRPSCSRCSARTACRTSSTSDVQLAARTVAQLEAQRGPGRARRWPPPRPTCASRTPAGCATTSAAWTPSWRGGRRHAADADATRSGPPPRRTVRQRPLIETVRAGSGAGMPCGAGRAAAYAGSGTGAGRRRRSSRGVRVQRSGVEPRVAAGDAARRVADGDPAGDRVDRPPGPGAEHVPSSSRPLTTRNAPAYSSGLRPRQANSSRQPYQNAPSASGRSASVIPHSAQAPPTTSVPPSSSRRVGVRPGAAADRQRGQVDQAVAGRHEHRDAVQPVDVHAEPAGEDELDDRGEERRRPRPGMRVARSWPRRAASRTSQSRGRAGAAARGRGAVEQQHRDDPDRHGEDGPAVTADRG